MWQIDILADKSANIVKMHKNKWRKMLILLNKTMIFKNDTQNDI